MATTTTGTRTERGMSLARGPAQTIGTILLAAGLYSLYRQHGFPPFSNFPNGSAPVEGKIFRIFGANGWTGMLTAVAGGLLLFGAAEHYLAKTMSLIVGAGLGAAAIISAISGNVLGLAAGNTWTEIAWGVAAAILLINALSPRHRTATATERPRRRRWGTRRAAPATVAGAAGGAAWAAERERTAPATPQRAVDRERAPAADEPAAAPDEGTRAPADEETRAPADEGTRAPADEGTRAPEEHANEPMQESETHARR